jgi:hypothetical protein
MSSELAGTAIDETLLGQGEPTAPAAAKAGLQC